MITGPSGSRYPFWSMFLRYSRVISACPMAREVRYMIRYPFLAMSWYSLATPRCVQSRPIRVNTWPSASDLVIVPSMSDTTTWCVLSQRKMRAVHVATPE